ncbi:MAG: DUF523 and DUF1722 domain-containing protein [bacterium]
MAAGGPEIRVGISACLLGEEVRFDGGHKRDTFITGTLARHFHFVPVCPEVDVGLGTPRESLRLVRRPGDVRLVAPKSGADHTEAMLRYAAAKVEELRRLDLSGYLLKRASPTCGMERVRVYDENGVPAKDGVGLFARVLIERMPLLPVEEEGRLSDPRLRENFIERVFAYHRVVEFFALDWTLGGLVKFHEAEKYLLLAHDAEAYAELGRLVAGAKGRDRATVAGEYTTTYMRALAVLATTRKHVNVLQHMLGYFRDRLDAAARNEVASSIEDFRQGLVPLVVPITLIRHYVRLLAVEYLAGQRYLEPHPRELMLRNHV